MNTALVLDATLCAVCAESHEHAESCAVGVAQLRVDKAMSRARHAEDVLRARYPEGPALDCAIGLVYEHPLQMRALVGAATRGEQPLHTNADELTTLGACARREAYYFLRPFPTFVAHSTPAEVEHDCAPLDDGALAREIERVAAMAPIREDVAATFRAAVVALRGEVQRRRLTVAMEACSG